MSMRAFWMALVLAVGVTGGVVAAETRSGETVAVEGSVEDDLFVAGGTVSVPAAVHGDLFAAGARVEAGGTVDGNLIAAGASVAVRGPVRRDLIVGALARVRVEAPVTGKLIAIGADVSVAKAARIGGTAVINGGSVTLEGDVGRDVLVNAGQVVIAGTIGGTLRVNAGRVEFRPGARIDGDIQYAGVETLTVPAGVSVGGRTVPTGSPTADTSLDTALLGALAWGTGLFLMGMVLYLAFPGFVSANAGHVARGPFSTLLVGVAALVFTPVLAALLMFTLIGFPIALLVLFGYLAAITMGAALAGFGAVALVVPARLGPPTGRASAAARYAVFTLVLALVSLLPLAGPWLLFLVVALGVGAAARTLLGEWPARRAA
jgi:cytoskeletal protein CcmA (bactofilin family)